jgi:nicotinate phosphoribosyltransferase
MKGEELFTDLYELTMLQAYFIEGMEQDAVFDLFIRVLPPGRNFLVACGLEQVLEYLEHLRFAPDSLAYLESLELFSGPFLQYLEDFRFTGNVRAVPEGTIVFPMEPIIEVEAPMPQAQLIETFVLNQITFQTMIASKGARTVLQAGGKTLVDFGSRRAHALDAGLKAARALYVAGYASTSNVLAGRLYGIPVAGTMAHSYVQAHDSEIEAFERFVESFPETVLLVDTYDTETGVHRAATVAGSQEGRRVRAVRLDSGDLATLARGARRILDQAGLQDVSIFASGGLDEEEIDRLLAGGAPIDAFGVGTSAVASTDAPSLDSVYKLVSYAGRPTLKLSPAKATLPGKKQVWRETTAALMRRDTIALTGEQLQGQPLLVEVMAVGNRTAAGRRTLEEVRDYASRQLDTLPRELRTLAPPERPYPVARSSGLEAERRRLTVEFGAPA